MNENSKYHKLITSHFDDYRTTHNYAGMGGFEYLLTCPFCGREGKLSVNSNTGVNKCWSANCDYGGEGAGSINTLFMQMLEIDYLSARRYVSEYVDEDFVYNELQELIDGDTKDRIKDDLGKSFDVLEEHIVRRVVPDDERINHWLKNVRNPPWEGELATRFINHFPMYWGRENSYIYFEVKTKKMRAYLKYAIYENPRIKTLNPPGKVLSKMLFGYNHLPKKMDALIICEAVFDAARVMSAGYPAVAVFGSTITPYQQTLIHEVDAKRKIFLFDNDAAEKAKRCFDLMERSFYNQGTTYGYTHIPYEGQDPDDLGTEGCKKFIKKMLKEENYNQSAVGFV